MISAWRLQNWRRGRNSRCWLVMKTLVSALCMYVLGLVARVREWESVFVEDDVTRDVQATIWGKAFVTFVLVDVAEESASLRPELEFMLVVGTEMRVTGATKTFKVGIIRFSFEKYLNGGSLLQIGRGESIDEITRGCEGIVPKFCGQIGLGEKSKAHFDDVSVLTFSNTVLFRGMSARGSMMDTGGAKVFLKRLEFPTPIRLKSFYFCA